MRCKQARAVVDAVGGQTDKTEQVGFVFRRPRLERESLARRTRAAKWERSPLDLLVLPFVRRRGVLIRGGRRASAC